MSVVGPTLALYKEALHRSLKDLGRSWKAALALGIGSGILGLLGMLLSPLGMAGGFLLGLAQASTAGVYLFLIEVTVMQRRHVAWKDIRQGFGRYMWDVISVLFVFWVASLLLTPIHSAALMTGLYLLAFVLFNPAPELVYQGETRSISLLRDAARFIFDNWPEWFIPQILFGALIFLISPYLGVQVFQVFGPFFGFTNIAQHLFIGFPESLSPVLLLRTVGLLLLVHAAMLFRGFLFHALSQGGRRARAWKAKLNE